MGNSNVEYGKVEIWTFAGDRINRTLAKLLTHRVIGVATSSYQSVSVKKTIKDKDKLTEMLFAFFNKLKSSKGISTDDLEYELSEDIRLAVFSKFVKCLPENLWYEAMAQRIFDFYGLVRELKLSKIEFVK